MPLVSIVIPAFNQARFIGQSVASALAQTHRPIEVIVVDDGSTDETPEALGAFAGDPNLTVIRQENEGLPAARNRGLADAHGDFVCFLDSDDFLAPHHIERLANLLQQDAALAFAYCDVQMVNEGGDSSSPFSVGESRQVLSGDIFESLLVGGYFPPHCALVRRRVLNQSGGFHTDLGGNADYEMWLRLTGAGHRVAYLDERLAFYRVYEGSMSRDLDRMRTTRITALRRTARQHPARVAAGLSRLQELTVDLHAANTWLRERWTPALQHVEASTSNEAWSLLEHFAQAKLVAGGAEQLSQWDTTLGGACERSVFLHPPAALEVVIPGGRAGRLTTACAIHPDAWMKPGAAACLFSVDVNQTLAATALLDPARREADRRWVSLSIDVPASATGQHVLTLDTRTIGPAHFGWALFRDVTFR